MGNEHKGNPVKAIYNAKTGKTTNLIASKSSIQVPDRKNDPDHGHLDVNEKGHVTYRRNPK